MAIECTYYPDIFKPYPQGVSARSKQDIDDFNKGRIPFYNAVRFLLVNRFAFNEPIPPAPAIPPAGDTLPDILTSVSEGGRVYFVSVAGILISQGFTEPLLGKPRSALGPEDKVFESDVIYERRVKAFKADPANKSKDIPARESLDVGRAFVEQTVSAVKEFQSDDAMFVAVYEALKKEGTVVDAAAGKTTFTILARQVAEVSEQLVDQEADPHDPQLSHMIGDALSAILGKTLQGRFSATDIDLPDLEEGSQADVIADNVSALSAVYFAAMLEDLKFFAVADKVVEQFMSGMVPVSRGTAGDALYDYFKEAPDRLTEMERRGLYARAFGLAQGSVDEPMPNREFSDLWIRFLSGVNLINRQSTAERLVVTNEYVFKNARDLAVNLSLHGYGAAHFAAVELQKLVKDVKRMLSFADVLNAYGVRDYNQLIERVSALYLGGPVNGVRQRTMATTGSQIIQFLAEKGPELSGSDSSKVRFLVAAVPATDDERLILKLSNNVDKWLAVNGTGDATVDRYAEPVAVTQQPTIPAMFNGNGAAGFDAIRDAMAKVGNLGPAQIPAKA
jgi:hypothetical protein